MSDRVPLLLDTEEVITRALQLRAAKEGLTDVELANVLLRKALATEIDELTGTPPLAAVIQGVMKAGTKSGRAP